MLCLIIVGLFLKLCVGTESKAAQNIVVIPEETIVQRPIRADSPHIDVYLYKLYEYYYHRTEALLLINKPYVISVNIVSSFVKNDPHLSGITCNDDSRLHKTCLNETFVEDEKNKDSYEVWNFHANVSKPACTTQGIWNCIITANNLRRITFSFPVIIKNVEESAKHRIPGSKQGQNNTESIMAAGHTSQSNSGSGGHGWIFFAGITGATVIVIAAVIFLVVSFYKRKRQSQLTEPVNGNYENLPQHNEGPTPMPTQCIDYAQPTDFLPVNTTYSVPYVEKNLDAMYAKPVPKSKRTQPPSSEPLYAEATQPEPNYEVAPTGSPNAEIQPVGLTNNIHAQVLPKNVQMFPKSRKPDPKYVNVFDNQRYANTRNHTSEYAEPAYCDIINNKK